MAEGQTQETKGKPKAEVQMVKMQDGREVGFAGKRRVLKETLIDESKVQVAEDGVFMASGAVSVRFDLRDGTTKTFVLPNGLMAKFAGHGAEQKYGDELASPADKPLSEGDMALALEDLDQRIQAGEWSAVREGGGGFSGASDVVLAVIETRSTPEKPLTVDGVKAFLQAKIDAHKGDETPLTRPKLYASLKQIPEIAAVIKRLQDERMAKTAGANQELANEVLEGLA